MRATTHDRWVDFLAFGVIGVVVTVAWLPTLASGRVASRDDDFLLHAARHEAVRKSVVEYHTFPLRSHWFGGGFPTLGEPEDPALNPLVVLSIALGPAMGLKLMGLTVTLGGALGMYALARCILDYTRWGALFSSVVVGASVFGPYSVALGNFGELCAAYLPLCLLLIALSCRGRRAALLLLPAVLYSMVSQGKQGFFMAVSYVGVLCVLDALPTFNTLTTARPAPRFDARASMVLIVALGVAFLVGMVRILPALEFINAKGGLANMEIHPYATRADGYRPTGQELMEFACGLHPLRVDLVTIGWLPIALFGVGACCFWRRSLPWVITLALFGWLALADRAPLDLFGLLQGLPVFSVMPSPWKFVAFPILLSIAAGSGQFFWLLRRLRSRWVEHVCSVALIVAAVGFLYPRVTWAQRWAYTDGMSDGPVVRRGEFFNVQGAGLRRNRAEPPGAVTYLNVLQNIGTVDWHAAMPLAENAIPRYFVGAEGRYIPNPEYRGEAFFVEEDARSAEPLSGREATDAMGAQTGSSAGATDSYGAQASFRPNSIAVQVTVPRPGILVVNQNYHAAWKTDRGELLNRDGLLAVRVQEAGSYTVHLRYLPRSFVVGLVLSVVSVALWVVVLWVWGGRARGTTGGAQTVKAG
ncbi:MAG: hypothetical protein PVH68_13465 [Armatimonadota bacterium]